PELATFAVAVAQAAMTIAMTAMIGVPSLLADDDAAVLGWWPLSARDLTLARLLIVLRPVMQGSAVLCGLPLAAHALLGPIPLVSALSLAVGLALQAIAVTALVMAVVAGALSGPGRKAGRRALIRAASGLGFTFLAL